MTELENFYTHYQIDEFYKEQEKWSKNPIQPFKKKVHKKLSHGVIPVTETTTCFMRDI